ncbi:hypothetical protein ACWEV4_34590 [Streptomyces sp. NPDC003860]
MTDGRRIKERLHGGRVPLLDLTGVPELRARCGVCRPRRHPARTPARYG